MGTRFLTSWLPDRADVRSGWREYAAAALSGLAMSAAFPPLDAGWVAWVALAPLFWALRGRSGKAAFYRGWTFGFFFFYSICFFLNSLFIYMKVVILGVVLLALVSGLYGGVFALGAAALRRRFPRGSLLAVPAWWVALESIRSSGELAFPFGTLAHTQWEATALIQVVAVAGTSAVSFLIVWVNVALCHGLFGAAETRTAPPRAAFRRVRCAAPAVALAVVVGIWLGGAWTLQTRDADAAGDRNPPGIDVLMIQHNIPQTEKWDSYHMFDTDRRRAYRIWDQMTLQTFAQTDAALARSPSAPGLIVWPETAIPDYFFNIHPRYTDAIASKVTQWRAPLLLGAARVVLDAEGLAAQDYNTAFLFQPGGRAPQSYDKIHLVPFGEDFSYFRYLPFMKIFGLDLGTLDRGTTATIFHLQAGGATIRFATAICFESTMPYLFRRFTRQGAQFLVVITNDGWYGDSSGAAKHFVQSVFRAIETRRWICRCANSGISAFISPEGRVVARAELNRTGELRERIVPAAAGAAALTPHVRVGPWFPIVCGLASLFALAARRGPA